MEKFFEKISSYNLLNNLLPGAVFCYLLKYFTSINLISEELNIPLRRSRSSGALEITCPELEIA